MKIDTSELTLITEADYEPEVDMLRFVVTCRREDLETLDMEDELSDLGRAIDKRVMELA